MKISNFLIAFGAALAIPFATVAATEGSCESSAVSVKVGSTYDVKLVAEYDGDGEYDEDSGVYYAAIKLSRGQSYTVWIDGFNSEEIDGLSVEPRDTTEKEDDKEIYGPSAYFEYEGYAGIEGAFLYSTEWDEEEDPESWLYYIEIEGAIGATATLHVSSGIQTLVAVGSEENPKKISPTTAPGSLTAKFIDGAYYFQVAAKAGTYLFATSQGSVDEPIALTFDSGTAKYDVEDVTAKVSEGGNVAYLVKVSSGGTLDFYASGSASSFGLAYQYASSGTLGTVKVNTRGTDKATWSIKGASGAYTNGQSIAILGQQEIVFGKVKGFSAPANRVITPTETLSNIEITDDYTDTYDPKDDTVSGATKLTISAKKASADRTLFANDVDHFLFSAKSGYYYDFELVGKSLGDAEMTIFPQGSTTVVAGPATKVFALPLEKGNYIVQVAHRGEGVDASYSLTYDSKNVGTISFAKTAVSAKKTAGTVTLSVKRSSDEGKVRVLYGTIFGSAKPGVDYVAKNGELVWQDGDKSAKEIVIELIPEAFANEAVSRSFSVQLKAVSEEDLSEDEYLAELASGKDSATVTLTESKAKTTTEVKAATTKTEEVPLETGTYQGVVAEDCSILTNGFPALASVTFQAKNTERKALSAKVILGGKTYAFSADTWDDELSDDLKAVAVMTHQLTVNKVDYVNELRVEVARGATSARGEWMDAVASVRLTMNVPDASGKGVQEDIVYTGMLIRDNSKIQDYLESVVDAVGYYTVALAPSGVTPGDGIPAGNGYLTLTIDNKGKAKIAGLLSDGTTKLSYSSIVAVKDDGQTLLVPVFVAKSPYCFGGTLRLVRDANGKYVVDSSESLLWNNDNALLTYDGEDGWRIAIHPVGGYYNTVDNLQAHYLTHDLSVETVETSDMLEEALASGYEYVTDAQPNGLKVSLSGNTLSTDKRELVKDGALVDFDASVNPCNVQVKLARATGLVTGSFSVWTQNGTGTAQKEISKLKHNGILLFSRDENAPFDSDVLSAGFFTQTAKIRYVDAKGTTKTRNYTASNPFNILAVDQGEPDWYADDWGEQLE